MKKLLSLILAAVLAALCVMPVSADVIFLPEDDFYTRNSEDCIPVERNFIATETAHSVNEPGSEHVMGKAEIGDKVYISYTYEDKNGVVWGLISYSEISGWIPMGYLEVVYDNTSFVMEFENEFTDDTGNVRLEKTEKLVFWDYPGSKTYVETVTWDDSYMDMSYVHLYKDPNGNTWGYVGYYFGMNGWIYTEDPSVTEAPYVLERDNEKLYPNSVIDENTPTEKEGISPIWIALILVGASCIVTVVLIIFLAKKKKN